MRRLVLLAIVLSLSTIAFPASADSGAGQVGQPTWTTGDSWQIRRPVVCLANKGNALVEIESGQYMTFTVTVVGIEKWGSADCAVLKITGPMDCRQSGPFGTSETYAYYRNSDLALMRLKRTEWTGSANVGKPCSVVDFYNRDGQRLHEDETTWPIPLEMPSFPISSGPAKELRRFNYPEKSSKHTAGTAATDPGEKDKLLAVAVEQSVGAASTADEAKTTTSVSSASRIKVTLREKMICSKSPAVTRDYCEQTWEPGGKWWTSARIVGHPIECVLVKSPNSSDKERTGKNTAKSAP